MRLLAWSILGMLALAATPGQFDYYVFSLSWSPEFCAQPGQASSNPQECASPKGFVVHGLWPEANRGPNPESCAAATTVPRSLVNELLPYMPGASLIQHEWATHGTCSGLSQNDYFTKMMLARAAIQIPVQISSITESTAESPAQIEAQFAEANQSFPKGAFRTACSARALTEVRGCFDKNLKPMACTASTGECSSSAVTIVPPH
jgi:ribonuclease T2